MKVPSQSLFQLTILLAWTLIFCQIRLIHRKRKEIEIFGSFLVEEFLRETETEQKLCAHKSKKAAKRAQNQNRAPIPDPFPNLPKIIQDYSKIDNFTKVYKNRMMRLQAGCQKYTQNHSFTTKNPNFLDELDPNKTQIILNEINEPRSYLSLSSKLLYCDITKCGSTNWKKTLKDIDENSSLSSSISTEFNSRKHKPGFRIRRRRSRKKRSTALERLKKGNNRWHNNYIIKLAPNPSTRYNLYTNGTYFRYLFVRDPLERLLSAYRDKVQPKFLKIKKFGKSLSNSSKPKSAPVKDFIKNDYKKLDYKNRPNEKLIHLDTIAFQVFLINLVTFEDERPNMPSQSNGAYKRHWLKYIDLCRVCSIGSKNWDFIGKVETIEADSEYVMERVGLKGKMGLGLHKKSNDKSKVVLYREGFLLKLYGIGRKPANFS